MTELDEHGRPEPPLAANEVDTLLGFLDFQRATLWWKCSELDMAGLTATVGPSSMTLGGMLKHLTGVEDYWFSQWLHGDEARPPYDVVDWQTDPDWDWRTNAEDTPEKLLAHRQNAVDHSRSRFRDTLANGGLDQPAKVSLWPDGGKPSLRWIVCHMLEEYARHNGHADLLRESVDGQTGE